MRGAPSRSVIGASSNQRCPPAASSPWRSQYIGRWSTSSRSGRRRSISLYTAPDLTIRLVPPAPYWFGVVIKSEPSRSSRTPFSRPPPNLQELTWWFSGGRGFIRRTFPPAARSAKPQVSGVVSSAVVRLTDDLTTCKTPGRWPFSAVELGGIEPSHSRRSVPAQNT